MAIAIQPYTERWVPAVQAFNRRLAAGGVSPELLFPEHHVPSWLPPLPDRRIFQEFYVATDNGDVRGAYILKFQDFAIAGAHTPVAFYHLPISEGIVSRSYSTVGVQMLRNALKAQPLMYCLGMGGFDRPLPQMLSALGWQLFAVPFYFKVCRPSRFLRHIAPLRQTATRRWLADAAAATGVGWLAIRAAQSLRPEVVASALPNVMSGLRGTPASIRTDLVDEFESWADTVWDRSRGDYRMIGWRDADTLRALYPRGAAFLRVRVASGADTIGWAVARDTQMRGHKYFGDLRVGTIVDCCAPAGHAAAVIAAAAGVLESRGVDLLVSNQSHRAWTAALEQRGFLRGPSNFIFAASKPLAARLDPFETARREIHFTRGDGDGPVNL